MIYRILVTWARFKLIRFLFTRLRKGKFGQSHLKTMSAAEYIFDMLSTYFFESGSKRKKRQARPATK